MPTSSQGTGQSTKKLHFSICACHCRQSPRHGHHTLAPRRPGWCLLSGVCSGTEYLNEACACNNTCTPTSYTGPHTATDETRRCETQSGTLRPAKKPGFPTAPAESAARQCNMARHPRRTTPHYTSPTAYHRSSRNGRSEDYAGHATPTTLHVC